MTRTLTTINKATARAAARGWQFITPQTDKGQWSPKPPELDANQKTHFVMRSPIATELAERYQPEPLAWQNYVSVNASLNKARHENETFGLSCKHPYNTCPEVVKSMAEIAIAVDKGKLDGSIMNNVDRSEPKVKLSQLIDIIEDLKYANSIDSIPALIAYRELVDQRAETARRNSAALVQYERAQERLRRTEAEYKSLSSQIAETVEGLSK